MYNEHSNSNYCSISSTSDNIINANSSLSQGEIFDKLLALDKIIFDCMDSLIYFYKNKNLINLTKKYIQNYLLFSKNNIYNNLKLIIENDNKIRISVLKNSVHNEENNINNINNNNINSNNNINNIINNLDLNKIEKPKSKYLSKREISYIKKDLTIENTYNNILNKNKKLNINNSNNIINDNIDFDNNNYNNNIVHKNNININDKDLKIKNHKKGNHSRNKSVTHEKLNQIKESNLFNLDNNISQNLSRNSNFTEKKEFHTQRDDQSLFLGESIEDLKVFTFRYNINDQYLVQTDNIDNLDNLDDNIEKEPQL